MFDFKNICAKNVRFITQNTAKLCKHQS
jgi:hypothetical protein